MTDSSSHSLERLKQVLKLLDDISADETAEDVHVLALEAIRTATKLWCGLNHNHVHQLVEKIWLVELENNQNEATEAMLKIIPMDSGKCSVISYKY
jgi:hypothetical protein